MRLCRAKGSYNWYSTGQTWNLYWGTWGNHNEPTSRYKTKHTKNDRHTTKLEAQDVQLYWCWLRGMRWKNQHIQLLPLEADTMLMWGQEGTFRGGVGMIRNGTCPKCTHHSLDWHLVADDTVALVCRRPSCDMPPFQHYKNGKKVVAWRLEYLPQFGPHGW